MKIIKPTDGKVVVIVVPPSQSSQHVLLHCIRAARPTGRNRNRKTRPSIGVECAGEIRIEHVAVVDIGNDLQGSDHSNGEG